jgi:hypothetical protein
MKQIKLDENFPPGFTSVFEAGGIDASSVLKQNISGTDDDHLYQLCKKKNGLLLRLTLILLTSSATLPLLHQA